MATLEQLDAFLDDPSGVLAAVGQQAVSYFQDAFRKQAFGSVRWLPRYPGAAAPKLNVAGAISDFAAGRPAPIGRRFDERPAGVDTGTLRNTIAYRVVSTRGDKAVVEAGSTVEYADTFNRGGQTRQPITSAVKQGISSFIGSKAGAPFAPKLAPLLKESELVTEVVPRQFVGVNAELERMLAEQVVGEVEGS